MSKIVQFRSIKAVKFFSWIVAFLPWISIYGTFVNGVSIADAVLICFLIYALIVSIINKKNIKLSSIWLIIFSIYLCLSTLISGANQDYIYIANILNRFMKFGLYCFIILFMIPNYLDKKEFFRGIKALTFIACIAIILQYIAYYLAGFYLECKIPFLSYANEAVQSIDYATIQINQFRPSSIFLEPAQFTVPVILYVAILLFQTEEKKTKWIESICVSLCLLLSTSSTALVLLSVLWGIFLLRLLLDWRSIFKQISAIIFIAFLIMIFIPLFTNTPILYQTLERILDPNSVAVTGRVNAGNILLQSLSGIEKWIGIGFGNFPAYVYTNSVNYLLYCSGYIGLAILGLMLLKIFLFSDMLGKIIILAFSMLCFSSPIVISINIIPYGAMMYFASIRKNNS